MLTMKPSTHPLIQAKEGSNGNVEARFETAENYLGHISWSIKCVVSVAYKSLRHHQSER